METFNTIYSSCRTHKTSWPMQLYTVHVSYWIMRICESLFQYMPMAQIKMWIIENKTVKHRLRRPITFATVKWIRSSQSLHSFDRWAKYKLFDRRLSSKGRQTNARDRKSIAKTKERPIYIYSPYKWTNLSPYVVSCKYSRETWSSSTAKLDEEQQGR